MEELIKVLNELIPDVDFMKEKNLIDDGILTSLDIVQIVVELSDTFDVEITPLQIVPENFNSAESMYNMIKKLQEED